MEAVKKSPEGRLLLDLSLGRYPLVSLVRDWVGVLQKSDEVKELSNSELVKRALDDIASGRVDEEEIHAVRSKQKAGGQEEEQKEKEKTEEKVQAKEAKPKKDEKSKK